MTTRWSVGLVLVLILSALPSTLSGSEAAPEIADPAGDGGPNGRDIVKVWFDQPDPENVVAHFKLGSAIGTQTAALLAQQERWAVFFKPTTGKPEAAAECYMAVRWGQGQGTATTTNGYFGCAAAGSFAGIAGERSMAATAAGTDMTVTLPLYHLAGFVSGADALTATYARVVVLTKGPVNGTAPDTLNTIIREWDRAPNSGNGLDYQSVGPGAGNATAFNVSGPSEPVLVPSGGQANSSLTITSGSAADTAFTITLDSPDTNVTVGFGSVNVTVPANGTATVNVTIGTSHPPGHETSFVVNATAPDGTTKGATFNVSVGPPIVLSSSPAPTANATQSPTNATSSSAGEGGIPGPPLIAGALVVAAAAWIRRRR